MLKKFVIFLFVLICLAATGLYLLTRPSFIAHVIKVVVNSQTQDWTLKDLTIAEIHVNQKGFATIQNIHFDAIYVDPFNQETQRWQGEIPIISLSHPISFLTSGKGMTISVSHAVVQGHDVQLRELSLKTTVTSSKNRCLISDGDIRIEAVLFNDMSLGTVDAQFHGDQDELIADSWHATWAGGKLSGRLTASQKAYTMHADVVQVDLSEIVRMNHALPADIHGRLDGALNVKGTPRDITAIDGNFDALKGADIPAAFLKMLLPYLPPSAQKKDLERLIANNTNVFFDHADIHVASLDLESLNLRIRLASQKLNLNMDITVDLNVEGGFNSLLNRLYQLSS